MFWNWKPEHFGAKGLRACICDAYMSLTCEEVGKDCALYSERTTDIGCSKEDAIPPVKNDGIQELQRRGDLQQRGCPRTDGWPCSDGRN